MNKILYFILSLMFSASCFSSTNYICANLLGTWQGYWAHSINDHTSAVVEITSVEQQTFQGTFKLDQGERGQIQGSCFSISNNEAYLILREDPPWFNPCRGTLMQLKDKLLIHFFCFTPNQWGYFSKS